MFQKCGKFKAFDKAFKESEDLKLETSLEQSALVKDKKSSKEKKAKSPKERRVKSAQPKQLKVSNDRFSLENSHAEDINSDKVTKLTSTVDMKSDTKSTNIVNMKNDTKLNDIVEVKSDTQLKGIVEVNFLCNLCDSSFLEKAKLDWHQIFCRMIKL